MPISIVLLAQVADTLHRMVEQLAWAEAEAARRQPVLEAIAQLDQARTECVWLATYEADNDRYKVPSRAGRVHGLAWLQPDPHKSLGPTY